MKSAAQQLLEQVIEHNLDLYILLVELKKAYDSIPRAALGLTLAKLGVPPQIFSLIKDLNNRMLTHIRVGRNVLEEIRVTNSLCQGCTSAPLFINLYFIAVMSHWHRVSSVPSFPIRFHIGQNWVGIRLQDHGFN